MSAHLQLWCEEAKHVRPSETTGLRAVDVQPHWFLFFHFYRPNWLFSLLFRSSSDVTAADSPWSTVTAPSKVWKQSATFCRLSSNASTTRNNLPTPVWWVQTSRLSRQQCLRNIPKLLLGGENLAFSQRSDIIEKVEDETRQGYCAHFIFYRRLCRTCLKMTFRPLWYNSDQQPW